MKTMAKVLSILALSLLVTNCKDVVDADENIQRTPLKYSRILDDQTHSVIMPLKTGNTWIYKVTEQAPLSIYYDTVVVYDPVTTNGEKWFKVKFPLISNTEIIEMTNTDLGLWVKCDSCAYNYTPYPVLSSDVLVFIDTIGISTNSIMRPAVITYGYHISKDVPVMYKNANTFGIKYDLNQSIKMLQGDTTKKPMFSIDYDMTFVPDSGMFKRTFYYIIDSVTKKINKTYDLIDCKISR